MYIYMYIYIDVPSSLPLYAHTQIGVGGVVVNKAGR